MLGKPHTGHGCRFAYYVVHQTPKLFSYRRQLCRDYWLKSAVNLYDQFGRFAEENQSQQQGIKYYKYKKQDIEFRSGIYTHDSQHGLKARHIRTRPIRGIWRRNDCTCLMVRHS